MRKGTVEVESGINKKLGDEKMKTKNKLLALVEIVIVLCSVFLATMPAIAAEQTTREASTSELTTASEDDYVLGVYGNANEDDTIDMRDLTYVKLMFFGEKKETELADAKYDDKINPLDFIQIKLIIVGKEKELTLTDSMEKIITVKKPINRIVVTWRGMLETLRLIRVENERIVGVESLILSSGGEYGVNYQLFFPEYQDKTDIGIVWTPDCEAILSLHPDAVFLFALPRLDDAADKLESAGITVIRIYGGALGMGIPDEVSKLGYIIDKEDEAEEFIDWHASILNSIKERVETIPEEDKPKVYFEYGTKKYNTGSESMARIHSSGGKNIFPDVQVGVIPVNAEAVVDRNPKFIVQGSGYGGYELDAGDTSKFEEKRDEIMSRSELQIVTAVREKQVYILSGYLMYGGPYAGCRGFLSVAYMAKWFHPGHFEDLDPQAIHQEYLERFQGLDFDLDKQGVFVYPEPI